MRGMGPRGVARLDRAMTDAHFFDEHPESVELWSPGSPLFPEPEDVASAEAGRAVGTLRRALHKDGRAKA